MTVRLTIPVFLILMVVLTLLTPQYYAGQVEANQAGVVLEGSLTSVYNLLEYRLDRLGISNISNGMLIPGTDTFLLASEGSYAILGLNTTTRKLTELSSGSLIGNNVIIFADNTSKPLWYGFAQDSGEILVVNASNPEESFTYYTASRKSPVAAMLESNGGTSKLVAVDEEGYAYIFTVGEPYWLEIGPSSHDAALASLPAMSVEGVVPALELAPDGTWGAGNLSMLPISQLKDLYKGNISLTLYYYNRYNNTDEKALSGTFTQGNLTIIATTYLLVSTPNSLVIQKSVFTSGGPDYSITLPAGNYSLTIIYERKTIDTVNNTVTTDWYTTSTSISVAPASSTYLGLLTAHFYVTGNYNLTTIAEEQGVYLLEGVNIKKFLVINVSKVNADNLYSPPTLGGVLWFSYLPVPAASVYEMYLYKPAVKPVGWPLGAEYLFIVYTQDGAIMYILDENLLPLRFATGYYEKVYLAYPPSASPAVTPDTGSVYLGAASGYIVELVWLADQGRYVAAHSYMLDTNKVNSLYVDPSGTYLLAASDSGLMQLIDIPGWAPLWRGGPGYTGVETGLHNLMVAASFPDYLVTIAPGTLSVGVMYNPGVRLYRLMIDVNLTLVSLNGTSLYLNVSNNSVGVILDAGEPVALDKPNNGVLIYYLPAGEHTLNLTMPGIGSLEKTYTVNESVIDKLVVRLREYLVRAYTPSSIGDPKRDPGYYLLRGPKEGVSVSAVPYVYDEELGYIPKPVNVSSITDANGTSVLVIWDGVSYQVRGFLEGYLSSTGYTTLYSPSALSLAMNPILYRVTFNIYDNQTAAYGAPLYMSNAIAKIVYTANGESVNLSIAGEGDYYFLPAGGYVAIVQAPHYIPRSVTFTIEGGSLALNIGLEAEVYQYALQVFQADPTGLSIGSGPSSGAQVNITMVWPVPGMVHLTLYTDSDGKVGASLRYGIYRVTVSHPYTQQKTFSIYLGNNTAQTLTLSLKTSLLSLYFKDEQFTLYGIKNVTVTLSYLGSTWTGNYTLNTGNKSIITIEVPYGTYTITANAKYYNTYTETLEIAKGSILKTVYMQPAMATVRVQVAYAPTAGNLTEGPVQGALVQLKLLEPSVPAGNITAVTGSDGIAVFYVRQGVYSIIVTSKYTQRLVDDNVEIVGDSLISEPVLPETGILQVSVLDGDTSVPIPNTTLVLTRLSPGVEKTIILNLANGMFNASLPAGVYNVKALYPGRYYGEEATIDLTGGSSILATFSLTPVLGGIDLYVASNETTARIGGVSLSLPKTPVPGASVSLVPYDNLLRTVYNVTINGSATEAGRFTLQGVRAGTYMLVISAPGYPEYRSLIQISPEAVLQLYVTLDPMIARVNLSVIDPGLADPYVKNYTLIIATYNGQTIGAGFTLPGPSLLQLPSGSYQLLIKKERYYPENLTLSLAGNDTSIRLNLTPITVDTTFTIKVTGVQNISGSVSVGQLHLYPQDWDLAEEPIVLSVETGLASASLRIGKYKAYLVNEALGTNVSLGVITIGPTPKTIQLKVTPPTYNVELRLMDADLITSAYGKARVILSYIGPFGSGTISLEVSNGTATTSLVPGNYSITVTSEYYEPHTEETTIDSPKALVIVLEPIRITTTINLVDIDGNPVTVANTTITIVHTETGETIPAMLIQGKIVPARGLRIGIHEILIVPPEDAPINITRATITITRNGPTTDTITAVPRIFTLKVLLIDPVTGKPAAFPFTVYIERSGYPASEYGLPLEEKITNGTLTARVPYGVYTITVKGGPGSYFIDPQPKTVLVSKDTEITITLEPKTFTATVLVTDDRGVPLPGALVVVKNLQGMIVASGVTDNAGTFKFSSVYGPYTVTVTAKGYKQGVGTIYLPTQAETTISLQPKPVTVLKRYSILIVGLIGLAGVVAGLYVARGKIMEKLAEEEEYF